MSKHGDNDLVSSWDLENELRKAGLLALWYSTQPDRDFDDMPTVRELLDWIVLADGAIGRMMRDMHWDRARAELEFDADPAQRF